MDLRALAQQRVGQSINNKWTIDRLVDVGGMAAVYAATHRNGKKVAIKVLHAFIAREPNLRERFLREGYVANQVDHPGAVSVLDDDITADGAPFLVMELLEGEALDHWLGRSSGGKLPVAEVLGIADQLLDVLAAFHARSIVHRDIKPGNIFITRDGVVKLLDFGLARLRDVRVRAAPTVAGTVMGTASYMPPEQAQGKTQSVDAQSDVFAVGAVMFRALAGRPVHNGETPAARLFQAMSDRALSLREIAPEVPAAVAEVVDTALAFEKTKRWESAGAMRTAVEAAFGQLADRAQRVQPPGASQPPSSLPVPSLRGASLPLPSPPDQAPASEPSGSVDVTFEPSLSIDVSFSEFLLDESKGR